MHFLNKIEKFLCKKPNTLIIIRFQPIRLFDKFLVQPLKFLLFKGCQRIYNSNNFLFCFLCHGLLLHTPQLLISICKCQFFIRLLRATSSFATLTSFSQNNSQDCFVRQSAKSAVLDLLHAHRGSLSELRSCSFALFAIRTSLCSVRPQIRCSAYSFQSDRLPIVLLCVSSITYSIFNIHYPKKGVKI